MGCFFCYCWGEHDKARGGFIYASFYLIPAVSMGLGAGAGGVGVLFLSLSLLSILLHAYLSLMGIVCLLACYAMFILRW